MRLEELLKKYKNYIYITAKSFNQLDYLDDLLSIGQIAIAECIDKYDETRGDIEGYIKSNIRFKMLDFLNEYSRTIRIPKGTYYKQRKEDVIESQIIPLESSKIDLTIEMIEDNQDEIKLLQMALKSMKSNKRKEILQMKFGIEYEPHRNIDIAIHFNHSEEYINLQVKKGLEELKELLKHKLG